MKVSDRVICIDATKQNNGLMGVPPPLIKGREYIIYDIDVCACGSRSFDVGLRTYNNLTDCHCGKTETTRGVHWAYAKRFAKVKEAYKIIHMDIEIEEPILN